MAVRPDAVQPPPVTPARPVTTAPPVPPAPSVAGARTEWTRTGFVGAEETPAPLTWGQRALWIAIERHGPGYVMISLRRTLSVPRRAPADPVDVLRSVGAWIGRHGSLRTRLRLVDRERCQVVADRGELPVLLVHADAGSQQGTGSDAGDHDGAALARTVAEQLADHQFDHALEWPQRVALVLVGGQVRQVAVVFSHTTVDFQAAEMALRDLRLLLLRGAIATPAGLQSADIARREQDVDQRRRAERAVAHWVESFGRLPVDTLPRLGPPLTPRWVRAVLTSPAADTAIRLVADRHRVTSSTVLLAATAVVCAAWSGNDVVGIHTMANNRAMDGYRDAIAKLNQLGLVVVDLADRPDFTDLLPRVWRAALDAYRHAYYDPTRMREAFRAAGYPYAVGVSPHLYLNDIRLSTDVDLFGRATGEAEVRAAMAHSSFDRTHGLDTFTWRTRIEVVDRPGAVGLALTADTAHLPPDAIERFLRDLERLLVDAAFGNVPWPWR
ncbi:condensation domain-containing protein [Micromonospora sp. NBC_01796]|uniref:condensation domain-containing protein n=1 Tax=Micromonospora sp. NBC_01796 TaxID=2975987 RepID=UPI002DD80199|nr:condensation domain-containing protein [Micromonospora sp. NBC_01796]WSA84434.1 condensation domain-containing protein [Micromonospora sp. NBC_01796]